MSPFKISFSCTFNEFWRYNLYITGKVFAGEEYVEFISHSDKVAEVGYPHESFANMTNRKLPLTITTHEGDSLTLYIYIVAHTLPKTNKISEAPPFECVVSVEQDGQMLHKRRYEVDQWSGDNIEIKVDAK